MTFLIHLIISINWLVLSGTIQFPLEEFFNLFNSTMNNADIERYRNAYTCNISNDHRMYTGCCSCDETCVEYRECCVDFLWMTRNYTNVTKYKIDLIEMSRNYKIFACKSVFPFIESKGYYSVKTLLINTCLPESTVTEQRLCSESSSNESINAPLPVKGSDGYIYSNMYCAKCNHVKSIQMINLELHCFKNTSEPHGDCTVKLSEIDTPCNDYKKDCPKGNKYHDLCHAFVGPFQGYSNYFCFLCTHSNTPMDSIMIDWCHSYPLYMPYSWSSLLVFSDPLSDKKKCANNFIEKLIGKCATYNCPVGYYLKDSICLKDESSKQTETFTFDDCLPMQTNSVYLINVSKPTKFINYLQLHEFKNQSRRDRNIMKLIFKDKISLFYKILTSLSNISELLDSDEEILIYSGVGKQFEMYHHLTDPHKSNMTLCTKFELLEGDRTYNENCEAIMNDTVVGKWQSFLSLMLRSGQVKKYLHKCTSFSDANDCPLFIFQTESLTVEGNSSSSYESNEKTSIKDDGNQMVVIDEGVYGVCKTTEKDNSFHMQNWYLTVRFAEGYLSLFGTCLSTVSYIVLMVLYHSKRDTYNVPTLCVVALYLSLFFGDGTYLGLNIIHLFGIRPSPLICDIINGIDYFFFTSAHIWCIILAADLAVNIKKTNIFARAYKKIIFLRYSGIVYIISFVAVVTASILRDDGILDKNNFGRSEICLSDVGPNERITFHILPLTVSFTTSMVFVLVAICHVVKTKRVSQRMFGDKNRINLTYIALKLIIMTGIPNGLGLINIPNATLYNDELYVNVIFGFLYSIAKAFRGVVLLSLFLYERHFKAPQKKNISISMKNDKETPEVTLVEQ